MTVELKVDIEFIERIYWAPTTYLAYFSVKALLTSETQVRESPFLGTGP